MSPQTQQMIMGLLMWVVVFGVFYFLLIRPQKKKDKELKEQIITQMLRCDMELTKFAEEKILK